MSLTWPLPTVERVYPAPDGMFAAKRRFDIHTGVDLYVPNNGPEPIVAMEPGIVVGIEDFTGPECGTPWWNSTKALVVAGASGSILYGEMTPSVEVGTKVEAGQQLGTVLRVLKKDKGRYTWMLHVELYEHGVSQCCHPWELDQPRPVGLLDPWPLLKRFFPLLTDS